MSEQEIKNLLVIAKETAKLAGDFLVKGDQSSRTINKAEDHDVKIQADFQSEEIIIDELAKKTNFSIVSEESEGITNTHEKYRWIIDPVDGSINYLNGMPMCCVSIGLWQGSSPVLGVIYDFNRNEMFSGIAEKGAWLNENPISVSSTKTAKEAILCTGFPSNTDLSSQSVKNLINNIQLYRKIRMIGSAALSLAYVASGRVDAYLEDNIMLWDVAGGIPIVSGAGGEVNVQETSRSQCVKVFATNGNI